MKTSSGIDACHRDECQIPHTLKAASIGHQASAN
jgi:hypothetical protein